jgi:hypothetical protein
MKKIPEISRKVKQIPEKNNRAGLNSCGSVFADHITTTTKAGSPALDYRVELPKETRVRVPLLENNSTVGSFLYPEGRSIAAFGEKRSEVEVWVVGEREKVKIKGKRCYRINQYIMIDLWDFVDLELKSHLPVKEVFLKMYNNVLSKGLYRVSLSSNDFRLLLKMAGYLETDMQIKRYPKLPRGHRFFQDCERETWARLIEWAMSRRREPKIKEGRESVNSWFATLTFKRPISKFLAEKKMRVWLARMAEALNNKRSARLRWISATEWQKREVIHFHVILMGDGLGAMSRKRWEHRWEDIGGGFCRIYDAGSKAAPYLAKYMNKSKGGEIQMGGYWRGLYAPASVACCQNIEVPTQQER